VRVLGTRHFEAAALFPTKDDLRNGEWALAQKLIARSTVPILEVDGRVVAFAVLDTEFPVVHYCFTVESERRKGHCRRLLVEVLTDHPENWVYTRATPTGKAVGNKLHGKYDPYKLYDLLGGTHAEV
jgi:hypothetical protein